MWEIVRKERRGGRETLREGIRMKNWNKYFKNFLGPTTGNGIEGGIGETRGDSKGRQGGSDKKEDKKGDY